ncbi:ATP-binding cassette domain-containing protein [Billgrantia gudaonensis]|uniref:ATP-binding cassette domain-containing protein n=1 Tax=Billgrantia gudaonensis TaxID=376427 RepID=A0A3S0NWJ2_9GAMM|nr:ATP-binding cassette domain-containing protein [Halomonas gudaonensis]
MRKPVRPPIGDVVLKVEHLDKHFGGLHVTNDVSFDLHKEYVGIIGPNGAGKTTVFNMISGFCVPTPARLRCSARTATSFLRKRPVPLPGDGVGRTFQIVQPFAAMTVEENIMVVPSIASARWRCRKAA